MNFLLGIFLTLGGVLVTWIGVKTFRQTRASRGWPSVAGVITCSGTKSHGSLRGGPATIADVRFAYEVAGRKLEGDKISFGQYATGGGGHARKEADIYPVGKPVTVFYDPNNSAIAILEPGGSSSYFLAGFMLLFGVPMMLVGLLYLLAGIAGMF